MQRSHSLRRSVEVMFISCTLEEKCPRSQFQVSERTWRMLRSNALIFHGVCSQQAWIADSVCIPSRSTKTNRCLRMPFWSVVVLISSKIYNAIRLNVRPWFCPVPIFTVSCVKCMWSACYSSYSSIDSIGDSTLSSVSWCVWLLTPGHCLCLKMLGKAQKLWPDEPRLTLSIFQRKNRRFVYFRPRPWLSFISQK